MDKGERRALAPNKTESEIWGKIFLTPPVHRAEGHGGTAMLGKFELNYEGDMTWLEDFAAIVWMSLAHALKMLKAWRAYRMNVNSALIGMLIFHAAI